MVGKYVTIVIRVIFALFFWSSDCHVLQIHLSCFTNSGHNNGQNPLYKLTVSHVYQVTLLICQHVGNEGIVQLLLVWQRHLTAQGTPQELPS